MEFKPGVVATTTSAPYAAGTNHTVKLAQLTAKYVKLYDQYQTAIRDADRKENEAENLRKFAKTWLAEAKAVGAEIRNIVSADEEA